MLTSLEPAGERLVRSHMYQPGGPRSTSLLSPLGNFDVHPFERGRKSGKSDALHPVTKNLRARSLPSLGERGKLSFVRRRNIETAGLAKALTSGGNASRNLDSKTVVSCTKCSQLSEISNYYRSSIYFANIFKAQRAKHRAGPLLCNGTSDRHSS